jgi:hypothetical protein
LCFALFSPGLFEQYVPFFLFLLLVQFTYPASAAAVLYPSRQLRMPNVSLHSVAVDCWEDRPEQECTFGEEICVQGL